MEKIIDRVDGRKVLFISTKNRDYIRNRQEIRMLKEAAGGYREIVFKDGSYLLRTAKVLLSCCRASFWKDADIIFAGFAPQLILPFLKYWSGRKYVAVDFFISLYDTFVCDRRYFRKGSFCARLLHRIDEMTLRSCRHVVVDTRADRDFFSREFHVPPEKMEVLYLEADKRIYDRDRFCTEKMSVLYFGSVLPLQGTGIILEAAGMLAEEKDISFTLIGPFRGRAAAGHEKNAGIEFYGWLPQEKLAEKIAAADLCLAGHFSAGIGKARRTIPGKAYIYEAMGRPMILGDNAANREVFQEDDSHLYVEMGSASALAQKITAFRNAWREQ